MIRRIGTVRWFSAQGYGFIDSAGVEEPYYFHITAVQGRRILQSGQQVSFEPTTSIKGLRALKVIVVETKDQPNAEQEQTANSGQ